jgi:serine/threonine protein phosphatase PrpC
MMRFTTAKLTHAGGRKHNEDFCDYCSAAEGGGCWVVADGLGGHYGGEIASEAAVRAFVESFAASPKPLTPDSLRRHLEAAHAAVLKRQAEDPRLAGMRTTLVALVSDGAAALWGHVGDTRLYCLREERLAEWTKDHSVPQAMVDAGEIRPEEVRYHEDRNRLLRDLGGDKGIRPTIIAQPWPLQAGDKFLLCTDGFWEHITETAMLAELAKSVDPGQWLDNMQCRVRKQAPEGHDNYTAMAVFAEA